VARILYVIVFGVIGVLSRYGLGLVIPRILSPHFPYATFVINLTGAFAIGVIHVLGVERSMIPPDLRVGIMVGLLGGYTTFSSYCLETVYLFDEAQYLKMAAYFIGSPILGFLAASGGVLVARYLAALG
jgi:CrcB protein